MQSILTIKPEEATKDMLAKANHYYRDVLKKIATLKAFLLFFERYDYLTAQAEAGEITEGSALSGEYQRIVLGDRFETTTALTKSIYERDNAEYPDENSEQKHIFIPGGLVHDLTPKEFAGELLERILDTLTAKALKFEKFPRLALDGQTASETVRFFSEYNKAYVALQKECISLENMTAYFNFVKIVRYYAIDKHFDEVSPSTVVYRFGPLVQPSDIKVAFEKWADDCYRARRTVNALKHRRSLRDSGYKLFMSRQDILEFPLYAKHQDGVKEVVASSPSLISNCHKALMEANDSGAELISDTANDPVCPDEIKRRVKEAIKRSQVLMDTLPAASLISEFTVSCWSVPSHTGDHDYLHYELNELLIEHHLVRWLTSLDIETVLLKASACNINVSMDQLSVVGKEIGRMYCENQSQFLNAMTGIVAESAKEGKLVVSEMTTTHKLLDDGLEHLSKIMGKYITTLSTDSNAFLRIMSAAKSLPVEAQAIQERIGNYSVMLTRLDDKPDGVHEYLEQVDKPVRFFYNFQMLDSGFKNPTAPHVQMPAMQIAPPQVSLNVPASVVGEQGQQAEGFLLTDLIQGSEPRVGLGSEPRSSK